jgi:hypothetical protein
MNAGGPPPGRDVAFCARGCRNVVLQQVGSYLGYTGRGAKPFGKAARDPDVWSGRALQVDFAELAVSGLASMYPVSDWSVLCSGPSWISARVRSR